MDFDSNVTEDIKKFISREFDDRVIIIDEIQNINSKKIKTRKNNSIYITIYN